MSADPFDFRCRHCSVPLDDPIEFCGADCERDHAEQKIRRSLTMITLLAHINRVRIRIMRSSS